MLSMNAYSKDLRLKTLAAIDRGIPRKEVEPTVRCPETLRQEHHPHSLDEPLWDRRVDVHPGRH
jgi:hypothetical protein